MYKFFVLSSLCFISLLLCACGFALRHDKPLPPELKMLYLKSSNPYGQMTIQIKQILYSLNIKLVDDARKTPITLTLFDEKVDTKTRTKSASAATKEYVLFYEIKYSLNSSDGKVVYGPKLLKTFRNYIVNEDQVLSSTTEQSMLMQEMQRDLVYQLVNQLSSAEVSLVVAQTELSPKAPPATVSQINVTARAPAILSDEDTL